MENNINKRIIPLKLCKKWGIKKNSRWPSSFFKKHPKSPITNIFLKRGNPHSKRGGKQSLYCQKWVEIRVFVNHRDDNKCQNPDCQHTADHCSLEGHHINYNKKDCRLKNIITLCKSCNIKANTNRKYWKNLYQNIINKMQ